MTRTGFPTPEGPIGLGESNDLGAIDLAIVEPSASADGIAAANTSPGGR